MPACGALRAGPSEQGGGVSGGGWPALVIENPRTPAREIIAEAQAEFETFEDDLFELCR